jgi:hypothetical protein
MATLQIGNNAGFAAKAGKNINGGDDAMAALNNANQLTLAAKRTRLTAINGTYYTAAFLDKLTANDIDYALRLADNPTSI